MFSVEERAAEPQVAPAVQDSHLGKRANGSGVDVYGVDTVRLAVHARDDIELNRVFR